jgi:hypothetical protein
MSLSVVYVTDTNHVVGALALTGGGEPSDVSALVGTDLPLRTGTATLPLKAARLAALAADGEPSVFDEPLAFGVELTVSVPPKPKATLLRLAPLPPPVTLAVTEVTITIPQHTTRTTPVLVLISGDPDVHLLTGEIPLGQQEIKFQTALSLGDTHGVLALVAGWAGWLGEVTVS